MLSQVDSGVLSRGFSVVEKYQGMESVDLPCFITLIR
jgi:hypothetical protein